MKHFTAWWQIRLWLDVSKPTGPVMVLIDNPLLPALGSEMVLIRKGKLDGNRQPFRLDANAY